MGETQLLKIASQQDVIKFIKENIIHRFGLSESFMQIKGLCSHRKTSRVLLRSITLNWFILLPIKLRLISRLKKPTNP